MGGDFPGGNFPRTELKEVKYFKEITDFKNIYCNIKCFKEKRLKSLHKAEAYLEPKRASTMELFL